MTELVDGDDHRKHGPVVLAGCDCDVVTIEVGPLAPRLCEAAGARDGPMKLPLIRPGITH